MIFEAFGLSVVAGVVITLIRGMKLDEVFELNSIHAYAEGGAVFMLLMLGLGILIPVLLYFMPAPKADRTAPKPKQELEGFTLASESVDTPTGKKKGN